MKKTIIPVGVRLPLATGGIGPGEMLGLCRSAIDLGFTSFFVGEHILVPTESTSQYPHTENKAPPFPVEAPWLDPLLQLTWLAAQLGPGIRLGTSILLLPLRNPILLAKQLSTVNWLTERGFSLGVGIGWLRDEYEVLGIPYTNRATRAQAQIAEIRALLAKGEHPYEVATDHGPVVKDFLLRPFTDKKVEFLWGGHSPAALRIVAACCDGWLPTKRPIEELRRHHAALQANCDKIGRDFKSLRLVVKPGAGPHPADGAIDAKNLEIYSKLGFSEAVLELPMMPKDAGQCLRDLELVAARMT